jgi:hypothetical protein
MTQQNKDPNQTSKKPEPPKTDDVDKQNQKKKAEVEEVAGRHKNDGAKDHKARR